MNWDDEGNVFIIDSRNTQWTVYKVDYRSKEILWKQGGKSSTWSAAGRGASKQAWQHDPEAVDRSTLRMSLRATRPRPACCPYSRIVWVRHDRRTATSTLLKEIIHPDKIQAGSQGNAQGLEHDHTF